MRNNPTTTFPKKKTENRTTSPPENPWMYTYKKETNPGSSKDDKAKDEKVKDDKGKDDHSKDDKQKDQK